VYIHSEVWRCGSCVIDGVRVMSVYSSVYSSVYISEVWIVGRVYIVIVKYGVGVVCHRWRAGGGCIYIVKYGVAGRVS
jgi:hypothetical protein